MKEIDVTISVDISMVRDDLVDNCFVRCVCGKETKILVESYNVKTRMLLDCPHCGAKLYFRDAGENRNKIVQVIDE